VINLKKLNNNVESYRILRTNVGFSAIDKTMRSLVVTSGSPHDGKSVVAANLAIFMARAGKRTPLIDADLRHPVQYQIFNLPANKKGLSNAILVFSMPTPVGTSSGQSSMGPDTPVGLSSTSRLIRSPLAPQLSNTTPLEPFIHAVDVPNLFVMPPGPLPPNSSEMLDSKAMHRLFAALANCGAEVVMNATV
jgi:non-specific protein-tyrosine kinase